MSEETIADVKKPESKEIELLNGKVARVGQFTFEMIFWIEEQFGSFEDFSKEMDFGSGKVPKLTTLINIVFQLLENKADFNDDVREFVKHVPISKGAELMPLIINAIHSGMPLAAAVESKGESSGEPQAG